MTLAVACAVLVAGCASRARSGGDAGDWHEVAFRCSNGQTLSVRFSQARGEAVLLRDGDEVVLPQQSSASGFVYSNGPNSIRGKGDALTVAIGRMVPLQCTAVD